MAKQETLVGFFGSGTPAWLLLISLAAAMITGARVPLVGVFLWSAIGTVLWVVALVVALLYALWYFIDWQNDYYIVTDQRVIHRERVLLLYDQQDECPISKVQNVNVIRTSWVTSIFDVGDVAVETQGSRSNVEFHWVEKPDDAAKAVMSQTAQARVVSHAADKAKIRATIRSEMRIGGEHTPRTEVTYKPKASALERSKNMPFPKRLKIVLTAVRYALIPPMRVLDGGDIIYHKHWLLLFENAGLAMMALAVYLTALITIPFISIEIAQMIFRSLFVIPVILLGLGILGWLVWRYEDWRNDIYLLKPDRVVDADRTPFGIAGSTQKTAGMGNIQNVTYSTRGFLDNVFNMGDVSIKTGGQDGELVFERVWNPRRVQRDIVDRLEFFQTARREARGRSPPPRAR